MLLQGLFLQRSNHLLLRDEDAWNHATPIHLDPAFNKDRSLQQQPQQPHLLLESLGLVPRVYPIRENGIPCFPTSHQWKNVHFYRRSTTTQGFLFLKTHKTGSSTAAGVHLRLARRLDYHQHPSSNTTTTSPTTTSVTFTGRMCRSRFDHVPKARNSFPHRSPTESFAWSLVREPTQRLIKSFFFFQVSREGQAATLENFYGFLKGLVQQYQLSLQRQLEQQQQLTTLGNNTRATTSTIKTTTISSIPFSYYLDWMSLSSPHLLLNNNTSNTTTIHDMMLQRIQQLVYQDYNFVAVTERMDESLVALSLLLNVPLGHVLYLPGTKRSGSLDDGSHNHTCYYIQPVTRAFSVASSNEDMDADADFSLQNEDGNTTERTRVQQYLRSNEFQQGFVYWDRIVHALANASLDRTIDETLGGRSAFERHLQRFQQAQRMVVERCQVGTVYPCTRAGDRPQSVTRRRRRNDKQIQQNEGCLWKDSGCRMNCLDQVATELGLWDK